MTREGHAHTTKTGRIQSKHPNVSNTPKELDVERIIRTHVLNERLEHCPSCGTRTGDGMRCITCEEVRDKELSENADTQVCNLSQKYS